MLAVSDGTATYSCLQSHGESACIIHSILTAIASHGTFIAQWPGKKHQILR